MQALISLRGIRCLLAVGLACFAIAASRVPSGEWPAFRANAARTASTTETLPPNMTKLWQIDLGTPQPAWPRSDRMTFDRAYQPVVAGGLVLVGSSRDDTLHAFDLSNGRLKWRFATQAPIRFAPAVMERRVYLGSDDGFLYALSLSDGRLLWRKRGGPDESLVLGNGRAISKWPVRGGVVALDGKVYFAAGIWPSDGIYLYALDAESGKVIWCNDQAGAIYMAQPHGGAEAESGVAAQGYLVADGDFLLVPTGRAVPAAFRRATGEFAYFHLQKYGQRGGALAMLAGGVFFNGGIAFQVATGEAIARFGPGPLAAAGATIYRAVKGKVSTYTWKEVTKNDRRGNPIAARELAAGLAAPGFPQVTSIAVAGGQVVLGAAGRVGRVVPGEKQLAWQAEVEGTVLGMAVADGRLVVSTDQGKIVCFGTPVELSDRRPDSSTIPAPRIVPADMLAATQRWSKQLSVPAGFAVDLGTTDGDLALAIAQQMPLHVITVTSDAKTAARLRERFRVIGMLGHRISVWQRSPEKTGLPAWCADLVVSEQGWKEPVGRLKPEAERIQRPYGGLVCLSNPENWAETRRRGPLKGAGEWTHQYADPANTLNSGDRLVGGRLTISWFRDIDFDVPQRHGRGPAPLFWQGILFHEGLHGVVAVNAYNGSELWRYEVPEILKAYNGDELMGTAGTGSNMCVAGGRLYLRHDEFCDVLDARTGRKLDMWKTPLDESNQRRPWGYLAADGERAYGSEADTGHIVTYRYVNRGGDMSRLWTESKALFAKDATTGRLLWRYASQHSIRHNAIAVASGRVFLIDRPQAEFDRVKRPKERHHPPGILRALDAKTGHVVWEQAKDIFGTLLIAVPQADRLIMAYQPTRFRLDSERGDRLAVFRMSDGERLWDQAVKYESRPFVRQGVIYTQGGAWDLESGKAVSFPFRRSYGCGILAASERLLVFRSATLGYYNIGQDSKVRNFGGMRPGCWINALPVGGMVVVPDASAGCRCSYLNRSWIALQGTPVP